MSAPDPAFDVAVSSALLTRVSRGNLPGGIRLYRPAPAVQFGRLDRRRPGFEGACRAAAGHGYPPVLRLVGGHAAAHDAGSLIFEHFTSDDLTSDLHGRFARVSRRLAAALTEVGLDARVGEIPGEYCPGAYSINSGGTLKVAGLAQRVVKNAALTTAVLVVEGGDRTRAVLTDVYRELAMSWRPQTAGAVEDHVAGVRVVDVERAILASFAGHEPLAVDEATLALAAELAPRHRIGDAGERSR